MEKHNFLEEFTACLGEEGVRHVGEIERLVKSEHEWMMKGEFDMATVIKHIKKTLNESPKKVIAGYVYSRVLQTSTLCHSNIIGTDPFTVIGLLNNRNWEFVSLATSWTFSISLEPLTAVSSLMAGDSRLYKISNTFADGFDIEAHFENIVLVCIDEALGAINDWSMEKARLPHPQSQDEAQASSTDQ